MACHAEAPFTPAQVAWLDERYATVLVRTPLRVARCGECSADPDGPAARVCDLDKCPLRHHAIGDSE